MGTLIGRSGHGNDIWATLPNQQDWDWLNHHKDFDPDLHEGDLIIGINDPHIRAAVCSDLEYPLFDDPWVHPTACLGIETDYGPGTHINYGATMTRTSIGNHTTIGPGVTIGGDVTIGDRCNICMGALIGVQRPGEHVIICDDVTIGAGSLVLQSITEPGVYVGSPVRRLR